jgi:hypothetical protein
MAIKIQQFSGGYWMAIQARNGCGHESETGDSERVGTDRHSSEDDRYRPPSTSSPPQVPAADWSGPDSGFNQWSVALWTEWERKSVSIVPGFVCIASLFNRIDVQDILVVVALRPKTELADA